MIITPKKTTSEGGKKAISRLLDRFQTADTSCQQAVAEILADVRNRGDEALLHYTRKFDAPDLSIKGMRVSEEEFVQAENEVSREFRNALSLAIDRIQTFHEREKEESWLVTHENGTITGRLVRPVESAGLYVPGGTGGKTPLVSSVLMNGIPAGIAGVENRIMVTPPNKHGRVNSALLTAARQIGITKIYKAGGPWAVAALAYGTETIPAVDVIVGPGNQYVTEAKRQVAGRVRIDMIAGPSEVLIVADNRAEPVYIAADMLAQAEHDPQALSILVTTDKKVAEKTTEELEKQLAKLSRKKIAKQSLKDRGVILIAGDLAEAITLANRIAPEHLELMIEEPFLWLGKIKHAGAIFMGSHTPEAVGDYIAGPNHVLPTMGTARFSSALGVETFLKKSSIISYAKKALATDAPHIQQLANLEGLTAHARSVAVRVENLM